MMKLFFQRQRPSDILNSRLFPAVLFFVALLPRLVALGQYITPDELNWVHRSVQFHQALRSGAWAETLTTGHPGVMTTWLGAIGVQLQLWLRPSDITTYDWITHLAWLAPENTAAFPQLATFLSAGRTAVAVANSLGLIVIFWLARRLIRPSIAAGLVILLAIDPFVAGLSGLLHVDGLMTTLVMMSGLALAAALAAEKRDWQFAAVSGAAAGCAILAKSAALAFLPFVAMTFLMFGVFARVWRRRLVWLGLVWLWVMLAVQLLLLPALWESPVAVYQTIFETIFHETEEVLPQTFFLGFYKQAHGAEFYPVALLYRLNPIVFVGLLLGVWFGLRRKWPASWWQRPLSWLAILWPPFFIILLSLATKKFDRYLLPALPMLFLLGVAGWAMLFRERPSWTKNLVVAGLAVALIYLATAVPFLLNAYNPLLGGSQTAKYVMPMGWGEAVSASAKWLAQQPGAVEKTAVAGIAPAFAPFFPGKTALSGDHNSQQADFLVETVASYQDSFFGPPRLRPGKTLLHTIRYDGLDQAWIYANDTPVKPMIDWQRQANLFGDHIQLLASATAVQNNQLDVLVQWQLVQPTDGRFTVQIRLLDDDDQLWSQLEMPLLNDVYFYPEHWQQGEPTVFNYSLMLPPGMPSAQYRIELSLFAADSGAQLPVLAADGRFAGVVLPLAELEIAPPPFYEAESLDLASNSQPLLADRLHFLGHSTVPETALTAGNISIDLFWQGTAVLPDNLQLQFFADEVPLARLPLSRFDSALWQVGQVIHEKYQVAVPADLAAGAYALRLELVAGDGRPLNSAAINLGNINIASPDRLFALPDDIGQAIMLQFDDLVTLRGYDLDNLSAVPGEPVHLTLFWQIGRQPGAIVSTFVHLVGPDGRVVVQGDQWPGGLPSTTWAANQVIIDEYAIQLPEDAPPGTYQIALGLYSPDSGLRLPIVAANGQVLPDDQFVLPLALEVIAR